MEKLLSVENIDLSKRKYLAFAPISTILFSERVETRKTKKETISVLTEFVGLRAESGISGEMKTKTNSHNKSKKEKTHFDLSERMLKRKILRIRNYSFVTVFCGFDSKRNIK